MTGRRITATGRRVAVEVPARTLHQPVVDQLGLVGGGVVEHEVDVEICVTVDALSHDALAAAPLDRVVQSEHHGTALRERADQKPEQDTAAGARAPCRAVEDAVGVHEPPLVRLARDPQHARHHAPPRRQDRANQQHLSMPP